MMRWSALSTFGLRDLVRPLLWPLGALGNSLTQAELHNAQKPPARSRASGPASCWRLHLCKIQSTHSKSACDPCCAAPPVLPPQDSREAQLLREGVAPAAEFSLLKQYIMEGGAVLVLLAEGGEARTGTNINFLLEEFGMMVDSNCVIA